MATGGRTSTDGRRESWTTSLRRRRKPRRRAVRPRQEQSNGRSGEICCAIFIDTSRLHRYGGSAARRRKIGFGQAVFRTTDLGGQRRERFPIGALVRKERVVDVAETICAA